jgi:soluble lytic murein transglycosylase-like protein
MWNMASYGAMQILFVTALDYNGGLSGPRELLQFPNNAVKLGVMHLQKLRKRYDNLPDALSAYNAGRPVSSNRLTYVDPVMKRIIELGGCV